MAIGKRVWAMILLAAIAAATALSVCFAFLAGCTGDPKSGALGDPVRALQIESYSTGPAFFAVLGVVLLPLVFSRAALGTRFALAVILFFGAVIFIFALGIQAEAYGTQTCFHQ